MNRYESLFEDIISKTREGTIKWRQVKKDLHADVILSANLYFRVSMNEMARFMRLYLLRKRRVILNMIICMKDTCRKCW